MDAMNYAHTQNGYHGTKEAMKIGFQLSHVHENKPWLPWASKETR